MISEQQKEKIKKEAKAVLEKFAKSLEGIPEIKEKEIKSDSYRKEGQGSQPNEDFKERMLKNAPNKSEDNIIAEKAKW